MQSKATAIRDTRRRWIPTCLRVPPPWRPDGPLNTSSNEEQRASRGPDETTMDINLVDFGLPSWGDTHLRLDVNQGDRKRAIRYPLLGLFNFVNLFGEKAEQHLTHEIFATKPIRNVSLETAYEHKAGVDPVSIAPDEAGAMHGGP